MLRSELDDSVVRSMRIEPVHDLDDAVQRAIEMVGSGAEIAVLPEGPLALPLLQA
jgi:hypothetical protein